jgi:hypothetical protein
MTPEGNREALDFASLRSSSSACRIARSASSEFIGERNVTKPPSGGFFVWARSIRQMSPSGPSVWTGRALQVESDDLEIIGLAHLYPALERNVCVPGHHGYPRALDLIRDSAPKAKWAT